MRRPAAFSSSPIEHRYGTPPRPCGASTWTTPTVKGLRMHGTSSDVPIVVRGRTDTKKPTIPTDTPPPVKAKRNSERIEIARIRDRGQNAILISADGGSAEQVLIDRDVLTDPDKRRWHYDETQVGDKIYLTRKHAEGDHLRNPLASELVGEEIHGPLLILKKDALLGRTGLTNWQFADQADEIEWMELFQISVKRIPDPSSGQAPELVFKPELPGVIGLERRPTRK
jgi:hypothetical protein